MHDILLFFSEQINRTGLYTIINCSGSFLWVKSKLNCVDYEFIQKVLSFNYKKMLLEDNINKSAYLTNISVLPPDIRPDINPDYCVIQSSTGCLVKDIRKKACAFCSSFFNKSFSEYSSDEILAQIKRLKGLFPQAMVRCSSCFLADGDAIAASNLFEVLDIIYAELPNIKQFESFISTHTILNLDPNDWERLRKYGVGCVYWGVESADSNVLRFLDKPQSEKSLLKARSILEENNIPYAVIVMCGLGDISYSSPLENHVTKTCQFINSSNCKKVYISKLCIAPNTQLEKMLFSNLFEPMDSEYIEFEYRKMIGLINKPVNGAYGNQFI